MTVLDGGQRYLRLDEAEGSPIVDEQRVLLSSLRLPISVMNILLPE